MEPETFGRVRHAISVAWISRPSAGYPMMRDFPAPVISDIQRSMAKARFSCLQSGVCFAACRDDGRLSAREREWRPMRFLLQLKTARGPYGLASAAVGWSVGPA